MSDRIVASGSSSTVPTSGAPILVSKVPAQRLAGRLIVPATNCSYPPCVASVDLLDVDFDQTSFRDDGLYLIEILSGHRVDWMGCRRFARQSGRTLVDQTGLGDWQPVDEAFDGAEWCIVGSVVCVYKPQ